MNLKTKRISYLKATELIDPGVNMFDRKTNRQFGTYKVEAVIACESWPYKKDDRRDFVNVNAWDIVGVKVYNCRDFWDSSYVYNTKLVKDLYDKLHNNE